MPQPTSTRGPGFAATPPRRASWPPSSGRRCGGLEGTRPLVRRRPSAAGAAVLTSAGCVRRSQRLGVLLVRGGEVTVPSNFSFAYLAPCRRRRRRPRGRRRPHLSGEPLDVRSTVDLARQRAVSLPLDRHRDGRQSRNLAGRSGLQRDDLVRHPEGARGAEVVADLEAQVVDLEDEIRVLQLVGQLRQRQLVESDPAEQVGVLAELARPPDSCSPGLMPIRTEA